MNRSRLNLRINRLEKRANEAKKAGQPVALVAPVENTRREELPEFEPLMRIFRLELKGRCIIPTEQTEHDILQKRYPRRTSAEGSTFAKALVLLSQKVASGL
jgi:hypothetical protein